MEIQWKIALFEVHFGITSQNPSWSENFQDESRGFIVFDLLKKLLNRFQKQKNTIIHGSAPLQRATRHTNRTIEQKLTGLCMRPGAGPKKGQLYLGSHLTRKKHLYMLGICLKGYLI